MLDYPPGISALTPSLGDAIMVALTTPEFQTRDDGCTLGGLAMLLEDAYKGDVSVALMTLINQRRAYVAAPIELVDADNYVMPVWWTVGASTREDIERHFRAPHGVTTEGNTVTYTYDLYVENVDDDDYPAPPLPYAVREAQNERRPQGCSFPFTGTWPPEALQVQFVFDEAGDLSSFDFTVGHRLT